MKIKKKKTLSSTRNEIQVKRNLNVVFSGKDEAIVGFQKSVLNRLNFFLLLFIEFVSSQRVRCDFMMIR